jgi:phosphoribosylglycinamide formyltransferase-1
MSTKRRIVVLSSQGPGNLKTVLDFCKNQFDADIQIAHLITDRLGIPAIELAEQHGISWDSYSFPALGHDAINARQRRERVCDQILERLQDVQQRHGIDIVVSSFRRILCGRLVSHFEGSMINVHPADLSVWDLRERRRRYTGIGGLRLSLEDGNAATRTTIHFLDHGVDTGPIICFGPWVPVDRRTEIDVESHESLQKSRSDQPALTVALNHLLLRKPIPPELRP